MRSEFQNRSFAQKQSRALMKGAGATYFAFFSRRFVTFLSTILLVRFVGPEEFGLMAAALLILRYFDAVNDAGVGAALVQSQTDPERTVRVAMLISLVIGSILTILTVVSAPAVSVFFRRPELTAVLWFLSPIFLFSALAKVQDYWLKKTFRFSARVIPEVGSTLVKALVSIALAIAGFGVWSLVIGHFTGQVVASVAYFRATRLRFSPLFDPTIAKNLFSFGAKISIITFVGILSQTLDQIVIGRHLAEAQLGYFVLGAALPELAVMGICTSASQVFFPTFSRVQNKPRLLRHSYLLSLKYILLITFPIAFGIALVAHDFVLLAYSDVWLPSIAIVQILALSALAKSISFNAGDVFKATGRTGMLTWLILFKIAIAVPALLLFVDHGIKAVALTILGVNIIVSAITMHLVARQLSVTFKNIGRVLWPSILASTIMVAFCVAFDLLTVDMPASIRFVCTIALGAAVYSVAIWRLDRHASETVLALVRRKASI